MGGISRRIFLDKVVDRSKRVLYTSGAVILSALVGGSFSKLQTQTNYESSPKYDWLVNLSGPVNFNPENSYEQDQQQLQKKFDIRLPEPIENPNYDYNKNDLDYIVNVLKEETDEYYTRVDKLINPSDKTIFPIYSDAIIDIANKTIAKYVAKGIKEFTDYGKKLIKKEVELSNKTFIEVLAKYFDNFDMYFHFRMDDTAFENENLNIYQAVLAHIKSKEKGSANVRGKQVNYNEIVVEDKLIKPYKQGNNESAGWTIDDNIYLNETVLKKKGQWVWDFLSGNLDIKRKYNTQLDNILEDVRERLFEKEWKKDFTQLDKELFIGKYVGRTKETFRHHELSHMVDDLEQIRTETLAMFWQMQEGNRQYEDLAQTISWIHMHKNSIYTKAGNNVLNSFLTIILEQKDHFKNIDYSKVTGVNEESIYYVLPQLHNLTKVDIKTLAKNCINNKYY